MKKKIGMIVGVLVGLFVIWFGYLFITSYIENTKLLKEMDCVYELLDVEELDMDKINEHLNKTVTKGDYGKIEQAAKSYICDFVTLTKAFTEWSQDEQFVQVLTVENYQLDGPQFTKTNEYLKEKRDSLEEIEKEYKDLMTDTRKDSYIMDLELDSVYVDIYNQDLMGDFEELRTDKELQNIFSDLTNILNVYDEAISFLRENASEWTIENNTLIFTNDNLLNEYNTIIDQIDNEK